MGGLLPSKIEVSAQLSEIGVQTNIYRSFFNEKFDDQFRSRFPQRKIVKLKFDSWAETSVFATEDRVFRYRRSAKKCQQNYMVPA